MGRLKRFEKTNEKLDSFNEVAQARLAESQVTFARHTQLLLDAKKDLQVRGFAVARARVRVRVCVSICACDRGVGCMQYFVYFNVER